MGFVADRVGDVSTEVLASFAPTRLSPDRFARVEELVREATEACGPLSPERTRDFVRYGSYLASWCDAEYLPLRIDVVFNPDVVEEFIAVIEKSIHLRSVATIASVLRTMSGTIFPSLFARAPRSQPRRYAKAPYETAEVEELFSSIDRARSAKRRHDLSALLVAILATGASGQETALLRGRDLDSSDGRLVVTLRRRRDDGGVRERRVTALPAWTERLVALSVADDEYLIGGGATRHSRTYDLCLCSREGRWPVELDCGRARSTYLLEVARSPNTVPELLNRAGVVTLEVYDELLSYLVS